MPDGSNPDQSQGKLHKFIGVEKILVIKLRLIGDVLLSTPAISALKRHFPGARISALVNSGTGEVLEGNPDLDEIIVFDSGLRKVSGLGKYAREALFLRDLRRKGFDMAVDLTSSDRSAMAAFLSGARYRLAFRSKKNFLGRNLLFTHLAEFDPSFHVVLSHLDMLEQMGIRGSNPSLYFAVSEADDALAIKITGGRKDLVHIHPVSSLPKKCWRDEYMAALIDHLIEVGLTPVLTAGPIPAEGERIKKILSMVREKDRVIDLGGRLTLKQVGALAGRARLFIGVDSAPMHIAAAVGAPVVALFGPTSETLWAPWCEKRLILSRDMPCRLPCKRKRTCYTYECLNSITPEEAARKIDRFIGEIA